MSNTQSTRATKTHQTMIDARQFELVVIGVMAFLTVVDLFATQALLPTLTRHYNVMPASMGLAVNASTLGMAIGGIAISIYGSRIERRSGIVASLALLSVPTLFLAVAPNLWAFALLRVLQGVCMASAFGLTLAHLGEAISSDRMATAFAAYITGNVASNLFGRLMAAAVVDHAGLSANFAAFASLNLAGALLAFWTIRPANQPAASPAPMSGAMEASMMNSTAIVLRQTELRAAFCIGFAILFAFIGTFTYVNFVLVAPPLSVGMMQLGFIYFVFLPSILTTPFAGRASAWLGAPNAVSAGLFAALLGLPMLLSSSLGIVLAGMTLVGAGTFFAQAVATGFVSRAAQSHRTTASGIYLASYFTGGLIGSAVLGLAFDHIGWSGCVVGIAIALSVGILMSRRLVT